LKEKAAAIFLLARRFSGQRLEKRQIFGLPALHWKDGALTITPVAILASIGASCYKCRDHQQPLLMDFESVSSLRLSMVGLLLSSSFHFCFNDMKTRM